MSETQDTVAGFEDGESQMERNMGSLPGKEWPLLVFGMQPRTLTGDDLFQRC